MSKYKLTRGKRNGYASFPRTLVEGIFWDKVKQKLSDVLENLLSRVSALEEGGGGGGGGGVSPLLITGEYNDEYVFFPDNNTPEFFDQALNAIKNGTHIVLFSLRNEGAAPGEENQTEIASMAKYGDSDPYRISSANYVLERPMEDQ